MEVRTKRNSRAVRAMANRWDRDLERLKAMFGDFNGPDFSDGGEMQRNLATAVAYADAFLTTCAATLEKDKRQISVSDS